MNLYYFLQLYLNRLDDYKFKSVWEKHFMNRLGRFISIIGLLFLVIVFALGAITSNAIGFLSALLVMIMAFMIIGYYLVIGGIKFLAINNERYMRIIMGGNINETINYDNVVN